MVFYVCSVSASIEIDYKRNNKYTRLQAEPLLTLPPLIQSQSIIASIYYTYILYIVVQHILLCLDL